MLRKSTYIARRAELARRIGDGIILIPGNLPSSNNYPNNAYYFRQDSCFLYFFGLWQEKLFGVIDAQSGESMLFGDDVSVDDIIWTGPQPLLKELGASVGVENCNPMSALHCFIEKAQQKGRRIHFLPPYRGDGKIQLSTLLGVSIERLHTLKSIEMMFAVAEMREVKSEEEIQALEDAFHIGYKMHTTAMRMCRAGVVEREISGAIEGIAKSMGLGVSFPSIVSQHGETLHNLTCDGVLENGRLLLVDAGGESLENYCSDHTRTYPVSGKFTDRQRDIYNIVLNAHQRMPEFMRSGAMYQQDVHMQAYRMLLDGLKGVGLIQGSTDAALASGAAYLFMPHGLGHGLGMDVHDCEGMGERSFDFSDLLEQAKLSGTCVHRSTWRLRTNTVTSDEPGIYFIPALIDKCRAEGKYKGIVNYDLLETFKDFGGIRIEDDVIVGENGGRFIGKEKKIPVTIEELEAVVGK